MTSQVLNDWVWIQISRVENNYKGIPKIYGFVWGYTAPIPTNCVVHGKLISSTKIKVMTGRYKDQILKI